MTTIKNTKPVGTVQKSRRKFLKSAAVAAPATLAAPAVISQTGPIKWRMQTYSGAPLGAHVIKPQIEAFNKAANGEMEIELFYADELVATNELFRALKNGTLDAVQSDDATMASPADVAAFGGYLYEHLILVENGFNRLLKLIHIGPMQFAKRLKMFSKKMSKKSANFEEKALNESIDKGCDVMVCGHVHQPQKRIFENKKGSILYLNSGDWVENLSVLEYNNGEWDLLDFDETLRGEDFKLIRKNA